jgi:hypothetical protein
MDIAVVSHVLEPLCVAVTTSAALRKIPKSAVAARPPMPPKEIHREAQHIYAYYRFHGHANEGCPGDCADD